MSLVAGFFFVRSLVKPRVVEGSWAPVSHVGLSTGAGDFTWYAANNRARVSYVYLTSHPSYALLLLLTAPIPNDFPGASPDGRVMLLLSYP